MPNKDNFVQYYTRQNLFEPCEYESFLKSIEQPLPTTFWLSTSGLLRQSIEQNLKNYNDSEHLVHIKKISWIPQFQAWSIDTSRKHLRKDAALSDLHSTIVQYTEAGHVWRQEEVSMLPPLLLDIQKGDMVLDMCAAPGSKTAQLLTLLSSQNKVSCVVQSEDSNLETKFLEYQTYCADSGCIVANESNIKRLDMLIYRMKRLHSSFPYAIFTNHDARRFPETENEIFSFNKILCDVPCSGDGTIRKNPHALKMWSEKHAYSLNPVQVEIALKAARLLCVGGTMVYSTCSLNPIENEAVVYHLKETCGKALELVDPRKYSFLAYTSETNKFRIRHGLKHWEVNSDLVERSRRAFCNSSRQWCDTFSPPIDGDSELLKTIRVYPQDQNTGAFFIAILRKVCEIQSKEHVDYLNASHLSDSNVTINEPIFSRNYVSVDRRDVDDILSFYQIDNRSSSISHRNIISHRKESCSEFPEKLSAEETISKTLGYVSESVYNIITSPHVHWKIENAGLRLFTIDRNKRSENKSFRWRVCNEAVDLLLNLLAPNAVTTSTRRYLEGFRRFVHMEPSSALQLLRAPNKVLDLNDFFPLLPKHDSENLKILVHGGLIFYVLSSTGIIGFSAIISSQSVQASVSKSDIQLYTATLKEVERERML